MGSWLTYGLGSESQDLPGFVVMISGGGQPDGGTACWGSGFLPSVYQGVQFRSQGDPVLFLSNPPGMDSSGRRRSLDTLRDLNQLHLDEMGDPEIATRINAFETAYRMQTSAPELMELSRETDDTHKMYGTEPGKVSFANNCLLARRLVERGVRFVQLYHRGWDNHGESEGNDIIHGLPRLCQETDRAAAALVKDLKERGLLDETLVIWGGEFGRTPMNEERNGSKFLGRDHHPRCFCMWMAGGGVKPGMTLGATDELGYNVVEDRVHVHDLQATILHLLGLDHTRLTYQVPGPQFPADRRGRRSGHQAAGVRRRRSPCKTASDAGYWRPVRCASSTLIMRTCFSPSRHQSTSGPLLRLPCAMLPVAFSMASVARSTSSPKIVASSMRLPSGAMIRLCPCDPLVSELAGALACTTNTLFSTARAWICARYGPIFFSCFKSDSCET